MAAEAGLDRLESQAPRSDARDRGEIANPCPQNWQLHDVVCNCHFGETVAAEVVAARVRRLSRRTSRFATFAYVYAIAATLLAGTVLLNH